MCVWLSLKFTKTLLLAHVPMGFVWGRKILDGRMKKQTQAINFYFFCYII